MTEQNKYTAQESLNNLKWALHDIQQAAAGCKHIGMNIKDLDTAFRIINNKRAEIFKMFEGEEDPKIERK